MTHPFPTHIDDQLFELVKDIDILDAITPVNFKAQKQAFFAQQFSVAPNFEYRERKVNVFELKRSLYNLPLEDFADDDLISLYADVVESYVDKLDQFASIGTSDFIYDCLRYYGEPSAKDIANAEFILHLPDGDEADEDNTIDASEIAHQLSATAKQLGIEHEIVLEENMIANALVSGSRIKVNRNTKINRVELDALCHHEVGVHLVTTFNARKQPLRVLSLGMPLNTTTQEGIAILCEYLSGSLTIYRMKTLALRVLAVQSMIRERDFRRTFLLLHEQYQVSTERAFTITARVYRGGGFTKDYLYLQGFHQMLNAMEHEHDFQLLLAGKTSLSHLPILSKLINKGLLNAPHVISPAISAPASIHPVQQFIAHAIR